MSPANMNIRTWKQANKTAKKTSSYFVARAVKCEWVRVRVPEKEKGRALTWYQSWIFTYKYVDVIHTYIYIYIIWIICLWYKCTCHAIFLFLLYVSIWYFFYIFCCVWLVFLLLLTVLQRNRYLGRFRGGAEGRYNDEYHCW